MRFATVILKSSLWTTDLDKQICELRADKVGKGPFVNEKCAPPWRSSLFSRTRVFTIGRTNQLNEDQHNGNDLPIQHRLR